MILMEGYRGVNRRVKMPKLMLSEYPEYLNNLHLEMANYDLAMAKLEFTSYVNKDRMLYEAGIGEMWEAIKDWVKKIWTAVVNWFKDMWDKIRSWFSNSEKKYVTLNQKEARDYAESGWTKMDNPKVSVIDVNQEVVIDKVRKVIANSMNIFEKYAFNREKTNREFKITSYDVSNRPGQLGIAYRRHQDGEKIEFEHTNKGKESYKREKDKEDTWDGEMVAYKSMGSDDGKPFGSKELDSFQEVWNGAMAFRKMKLVQMMMKQAQNTIKKCQQMAENDLRWAKDKSEDLLKNLRRDNMFRSRFYGAIMKTINKTISSNKKCLDLAYACYLRGKKEGKGESEENASESFYYGSRSRRRSKILDSFI